MAIYILDHQSHRVEKNILSEDAINWKGSLKTDLNQNGTLKIPGNISPVSFGILKFVVDGKLMGSGIYHILMIGGQIE